MKVRINFDLFHSAGTPLGIVSGHLDLIDIPQAGDFVSFLFPENGVFLEGVPEFPGNLRVTSRIFVVGESSAPTIFFDPIMVTNSQNGDLIFEYMENAYSLLITRFS